MITQDSIDIIRGATVYDNDGDKIGKVGEVYLDDSTGQPAWMTVTTGLFGTAQSFVPLQEASLSGEDVRVPYTKATIKDAPRVDADGHLDVAEEDALYDYYGVGGVSSGTTGETTGAAFADDDRGDRFEADRVEGSRVESDRVEGSRVEGDRVMAGTTDMTGETRGGYREGRESREGLGTSRGTSVPTTDDAMTRSEEQLHIGTEAREASRARLRKYVVTERQSVSVPVSHDEVRLEREPITGGNAGDALDGPAISEEVHEVILQEEVPVVRKETHPVERVRAATQTVTTDQQVSDDVRKERIEMEGDRIQSDGIQGDGIQGDGTQGDRIEGEGVNDPALGHRVRGSGDLPR